MLHLVTAASANVLMLLGCVLGVGFMIRFLVALTLEGETHFEDAARPGGLHYAADASRIRTRRRAAVANSASHLAIGVVRITTALTRNTGNVPRDTAVGRLHAATAGESGREVDVTAERAIAPAEATHKSENSRHARHHFRRHNDCLLFDFHRVCEVLRSHSLR